MKIKVNRESTVGKIPKRVTSFLKKESTCKQMKRKALSEKNASSSLKINAQKKPHGLKKNFSKKQDKGSMDEDSDASFSEMEAIEFSDSECGELENDVRKALEKQFARLNKQSEQESATPVLKKVKTPLLDKSKPKPQASVSDSPVDEAKLTKAQKKRLKKKEAKLEKRAAREKRAKSKEEGDEELPTSSHIVFPKRKGFVPLLDTDEKRLAAAQARLAEASAYVLQIRPTPRKCTPGLLKDLCPLAINIRFPSKSGAHYAFLQFRNEREMQAAQQMLATKQLNNKPLKVQVCSNTPKPDNSDWRKPDQRQMAEFNWNVIHVTHLARATTRFDLGQVFRKASSIKFPTYEDGSSKGVCWLTYRSKHDALQAFETRHGTFVRGSPIYVNFALRQKPKPQEPIPSIPPEDEQSSIAITRKRPNPSSDSSDVEDNQQFAPSTKLARVAQKEASEDDNAEFVIDRQKPATPKSAKHGTHIREASHPKLLNKHQLRKKGSSSSTRNTILSPLDALLRPPDAKPKNAKKSKKVTKRGKPSKHR